MHVRALIAGVTLILVTGSAGCSGGPGPADELESLLEALGNPTLSSSRLGAELYRVLDEGSRAAVDARAKALGDRLGFKVDAREVLQVRGLTHGGRVGKVEVVAQDEQRATVEVSFAPILFVAPPESKPGGAEGSGSAAPPQLGLQPLRLEMVREAGRWRLVPRDLAKLVAEVPLEATTRTP